MAPISGTQGQNLRMWIRLKRGNWIERYGHTVLVQNVIKRAKNVTPNIRKLRQASQARECALLQCQG